MKHFFKTVIVPALIICCSLGCRTQARDTAETGDAVQPKDTIIKHIRASFQKINGDLTLKKVELDNDEFISDTTGEIPDNGCSLTGYYKKGTIYKMTAWIGISYCLRQYDYYLDNGRPFFIYETEKDFAHDSAGVLNHNKLVPAFEGRYYLDNGKVIDMKLKGKKLMDQSPSAKSVLGLAADSKDYLKLIAARLKKGS